MKSIVLFIISILYFTQAQAYEYEGVHFPKDSILAGNTLIDSRSFIVTKIDTLDNTLFYRCSYYGVSDTCSITFNYGQMNVFYYYENAKEQSIGFKRRCDKIANSRYSMLVSEGSNENTLRFVDYPSMVIISKIDNNIVMVVVADIPNNIMQNSDRYPELMKLKDTYDAFHDYHTY